MALFLYNSFYFISSAMATFGNGKAHIAAKSAKMNNQVQNNKKTEPVESPKTKSGAHAQGYALETNYTNLNQTSDQDRLDPKCETRKLPSGELEHKVADVKPTPVAGVKPTQHKGDPNSKPAGLPSAGIASSKPIPGKSEGLPTNPSRRPPAAKVVTVKHALHTTDSTKHSRTSDSTKLHARTTDFTKQQAHTTDSKQQARTTDSTKQKARTTKHQACTTDSTKQQAHTTFLTKHQAQVVPEGSLLGSAKKPHSDAPRLSQKQSKKVEHKQ